MLTLYRRALALRDGHSALGSGEATVETVGDVLTVHCAGDGERVRCVVNMGAETVLVRATGPVLLASSTSVRQSPGTVALPAHRRLDQRGLTSRRPGSHPTRAGAVTAPARPPAAGR